MRNLVSQTLLGPSTLLVVLACLAGCAGIDQSLTSDTVQLAPQQEARLGAAVEDRLLQMLGGRYHNPALVNELQSQVEKELGTAGHFTVVIADKNAVALFALPDDRVVLTRGLMAKIRHQGELVDVIRRAAALNGTVSTARASRAARKATTEILSLQESLYDPESGSIRLARIFARKPCAESCLTSSLPSSVSRPGTLPESIRLLKDLQPAYALLEEARQLEKANKPAQAITLYLEAATMAPDEPYILGALGTAYLRAGELQTARLNLQKAVRLQPDYYRTRMGLGYLYLQQGQVSKANDELAESVRLLPVTENLFLLAEAREKGGDVAGGMSLYRLIVDKDPQSKLGRTAASRLARAKGVQ